MRGHKGTHADDIGVEGRVHIALAPHEQVTLTD
jgi:hypothetical protein